MSETQFETTPSETSPTVEAAGPPETSPEANATALRTMEGPVENPAEIHAGWRAATPTASALKAARRGPSAASQRSAVFERLVAPFRPAPSDSPAQAALREAAGVALIVFLLCVPLVGFRSIDTSKGLAIATRFDEVAVATLLAFLGQFGVAFARFGRRAPVALAGLACAGLSWILPFPTQMLKTAAVIGGAALVVHALIVGRRSKEPQAREKHPSSGRWTAMLNAAIVPLGVGFAAVMPFLPFCDRFLLDTGIMVLLYVMLGWGLNIVVGLAGLLDLGFVAFYAVGAYTYGLMSLHFGLSFWAALPLSGLFAAFAGLLLGFPVLRLRGDYFAIVTLGFGEIIRILLLNWTDVTNGPVGVAGIPRPSFFGMAQFTSSPEEGVTAFHELFGLEYNSLQRLIFLYYVILALALFVNLFTLRIRKLPIGRAWEALREDDIACAALGINRTNIKLAAFAISAMFGGFAGTFFAAKQGFISPESFVFMESAVILAIVVLGGMGSQAGIVLAALLLVGLPEAFRDLKEYRMLAFGIGMVLIMLWRPRGMLAHREPTIRLHKRRRTPSSASATPDPQEAAST